MTSIRVGDTGSDRSPDGIKVPANQSWCNGSLLPVGRAQRPVLVVRCRCRRKIDIVHRTRRPRRMESREPGVEACALPAQGVLLNRPRHAVTRFAPRARAIERIERDAEPFADVGGAVELQKDESYWRDQRNWSVLLPNLGRSIDPQRLVDDYQNNGKVNREAETIWVSQHLNIEIGTGLKTDAWAGAEFWADAQEHDAKDAAQSRQHGRLLWRQRSDGRSAGRLLEHDERGHPWPAVQGPADQPRHRERQADLRRDEGARARWPVDRLHGRRVYPRHQAERAASHHQDHQVAAGSVADHVP